MDEQDPYEALPPTTTVAQHMLAGAAAGITEHCVMYPVDCVKTRMQSLIPDPKADYRNVLDAFRQIVRYEGISNSFRGMTAVIGGAGPAHALYFACYEKLKKTLTNGQRGNHWAHAVSGSVATILHDAVMNPADVIKQRMQVFGSPYSTCSHCTKTIMRSEGFGAFYRSYWTQLTMNVPFQMVHFVTYEFMQDWLNHDRQYNPLSHIISGGLAGAAAATITMPFDVCKTLLNTQECCAKRKVTYTRGMLSAGRTIFEYNGIRGFYKGLQARVVFQTPATAISWSVYEMCKWILTENDKTEDHYITSVKGLPRVQAMSEPELGTASPPAVTNAP